MNCPCLRRLEARDRPRGQLDAEPRLADQHEHDADNHVDGRPDGGRDPAKPDQERQHAQQATKCEQADRDPVANGKLLRLLLGERDLQADEPADVLDYLCREITGREIEIDAEPEDRPGDVPIYVSDCSRVRELGGWAPRRSARQVLEDIDAWIGENETMLKAALSQPGGRP